MRELTYTAEITNSKGGCIGYTTSNCKQMCSDIIQCLIVGENMDVKNPVKTEGNFKYNGRTMTLTTNYEL